MKHCHSDFELIKSLRERRAWMQGVQVI